MASTVTRQAPLKKEKVARKKAAADLYLLLSTSQHGLSQEQQAANHAEFMRRGRAVLAQRGKLPVPSKKAASRAAHPNR